MQPTRSAEAGTAPQPGGHDGDSDRNGHDCSICGSHLAAIECGWHSKDNWPEGFESDVVDSFVALKKKHRSFLVQSSML
jgi:hypothetical protein